MTEINPNDLHFFGHQTFPLRHLWLPKAVNHTLRYQNLSDYDKIMEEQGLGQNMAKALRHWAESAQIIKRTDYSNRIDSLTEIGEIIFSNEGDQYLQFTDTIWLIHYLISTNHKKNALWYFLFNHYPEKDFTRDSFIYSIKSWLNDIDKKVPSDNQLNRDFKCCMNMYCHKSNKPTSDTDDYFSSPFTQLKIIIKENDNYSFRSISPNEISDNLFSFCLVHYLNIQKGNKAIPFSEILYGEKSPGKIFCFSENTLVEKLENFVKLYTEYFEFESTAGMKTLYKLTDFNIQAKTLLKRVFVNVN